MIVRAKFEVESKEEGRVILRAVTSGSRENEDFFKYTPAGSIDLQILNQSALKHFEVGREYYVDFTDTEAIS